MGIFQRIREVFTGSPGKLANSAPVVGAKPLWDQFQRIGGGLTPLDVSNILRVADGGQPASLLDLWNESRQKDGHLQGVCKTREDAVALTDLDFLLPEDATDDERDAAELCRRVVGDFKNWPTLIEHMAGSFLPGHATSQLRWEKTSDGLLLPVEAKTIPPREFIFEQTEGALRYARFPGDTVGVDLLAEFPARIIQVQRRIVGDVQVREGLIRVLVWAALLRNWGLRDWIALGEIGWKPWRLGYFEPGTTDDDVAALVRALEELGNSGVAALPAASKVEVQWPKNQSQGSQSSHRELFDVLGREISKAVIGQTTTTEPGPNGDRASTETRDKVRGDIKEVDCRATAAVLRHHMFSVVVAVNKGPSVRCPVPWFQTEEVGERKSFAEAVKILGEAGLKRIPARWVRDEVGMPEPVEGEELLEPTAKTSVQVPGGGEEDEDDLDIPIDVEGEEEGDEGDEGESSKGIAAKPRHKASGSAPGSENGLDYAERVEESARALAAKKLAPTVAAMLTEISKADGYQDALERIERRYGELASPADLKLVTEAAMLMAQLAGAAAVREDTPELEE